MELKRLADSVSLSLPDDLLWTDEHAWSPAVSSVSYLITGALLIQSATRQSGRPITLVGPADMAWVTRAVVDALYDWASVPAQSFELTAADARVFTVVFRHQDTAIEAEPILGIPSRSPSDFYRLTLRLMEV